MAIDVVAFALDPRGEVAYSTSVQVYRRRDEGEIMIRTTYSEARQNLASLLDQVSDDREIAIIKRRGYEDVALVSADELAGLLETAHLLRSPANARRLLTALRRAQTKKLAPKSLNALRAELGLDGED